MTIETQNNAIHSSLAPIVLFVYNRPKHTLEILEALFKNELADQSVLYIFSDGYNDNFSEKTISDIKAVRSLISNKQWCKEVIIKEADRNKGLAESVIDGVTEIIAKHGKVIVLEDDLIPSNYFLDYMNRALTIYQESLEVFQIAGFSFPVKGINSEHGSYFLQLTSTWGWATWKRAWDTIDFECKDYSIIKKDKKLAYRFNINGSYNYKKMFIQQMESEKVSSWGIRFYWNVFKQRGLILYPDKSLVLNNGWDSSGRHKDSYNIFPIDNWDLEYKVSQFPDLVKVNNHYSLLISKYIKNRTSLITKIIYKSLSGFKNFLRKRIL